MFRHKNRTTRTGATLILICISMVALLGMCAFAIDVGHLRATHAELQAAADAGAMAAARKLVTDNGIDVVSAQLAGKQFAEYHVCGGQQLSIVDNPSNDANGDIVIGKLLDYDNYGSAFVPTIASDANSVKVVARRTESRGTAVQLFFARVLGITEADTSATAIASLYVADEVSGMPIALRTPGFGLVDPDAPHKPGPSEPANGQEFEVGEQVTMFIYGKGKDSPIHLGLDIEEAGSSDSLQDVLKGDEPPYPMEVGDEFYVVGEGTGHGGIGSALDDRVDKFGSTDPMRDIIVPVVETLPTSRNANGDLTGKVRIVELVAVHLDDVIEVEVPDPEKPGKTIEVEYLVGTVTRKVISSKKSSSPSGPTQDSSLFTVRLTR